MKKNIFKILCFTVIFTLLFGLFSISAFAAKDNKKLYVYNWGEYIADGKDGTMNVLEEFKKQTGIEVVYSTYSDNEAMYSKIRGGGVSYDIVIPSDYMIAKLISEDRLEKINFDNIPNMKYIDKNLLNPDYDPNDEYSVPYTWGTVGIFYNSKYVTETVDSWDILWNEKYKDKIMMFGNPRDAFGIAQKRLGYSFNSNSESELREAYELLKEQKPLVRDYVMDEIFDIMASGEAWIAPYYAGDSLLLKRTNKDIKFAYPKEGTNRFVDAMCILKGANKENAEKFINFMCETEIAKANAEVVGYCTPQTESKKLLSKEITENTNIYPTDETLKNTETFSMLSDSAATLMDSLWTELRVEPNGKGNATIYIIFGVALILVILLVVFLGIKRKKRARFYDDE